MAWQLLSVSEMNCNLWSTARLGPAALLLLAVTAFGQTPTQVVPHAPTVDTVVVGDAQPHVEAPRAGEVVELPPPRPPALGLFRAPLPPELSQFIRDPQRATALGKALFWDMSVGSDGKTACASCHYHAGADARQRNQIHPGATTSLNGSSGASFVNAQLSAKSFPLAKATTAVVGSQGVHRGAHLAAPTKAPAETSRFSGDATFNSARIQTRQVTGRNTPSVLNAVFFERTFWDGRANHVFNGISPFGSRDTNALVYVTDTAGRTLRPVQIRLTPASLASQAVGPIMSDVEMAFTGRSARGLGRKLLPMNPLIQQPVAVDDSVLGAHRLAAGKGLRGTYEEWIKAAFRPEYWSARGANVGGWNQMELNFPLFFGLSVMLYESTLVSDQTPYDRYALGDLSALSPNQIAGLNVFMGKAKCIECHNGPLFSNAAKPSAGDGTQVEHMATRYAADGPAIYDRGFYNIGVRPTDHDLGVGGRDPFGNPLSFSSQYRRMLEGGSPLDAFRTTTTLFEIPLPRVGVFNPLTVRPVDTAALRTATAGAFKVPSLRNVDLTGPYFHTGSQSTLKQVVQFYNRGGDFSHANRLDIPPDIRPLDLSEDEENALVEFMRSLTDERVRYRRAPFDHPALLLVEGHRTDIRGQVAKDGRTAIAQDAEFWLPPVGSTGGTQPLLPFLGLSPLKP